jgi:hypothetical protein
MTKVNVVGFKVESDLGKGYLREGSLVSSSGVRFVASHYSRVEVGKESRWRVRSTVYKKIRSCFNTWFIVVCGM